MSKLKLRDEKEGLLKDMQKVMDGIMRHKAYLQSSGEYRNFERRFVGDILYLLKGSRWACDCYEKYGCNDDHLFSLGKTCLKELEAL